MLNSVIAGDRVEEEICRRISIIHSQGPVHAVDLEFLAYAKKFHQTIFSKYESKLLYVLGQFYKSLEPRSFIETVYNLYSEGISKELDEYFTPVQASIYLQIRAKKYFSFSASTSAGKSYLFRTLIKREKKDIVIVVPSRALISEYYKAVMEIVEDSNEILVLQFADNINTKKTERRIYIVTPERAIELFKISRHLSIGLFLMDEAHISEDPSRGIKFDWFVRRIGEEFKDAKKVFAHPFVENPEAQLKKHFIKEESASENFRQASVGKIFLERGVDGFKYFSPNVECDDVVSQTDPVMSIIKNKGSVLIYIAKSKLYEDEFDAQFLPYIKACPQIRDDGAKKIISELAEYLGVDSSEDKKSNLLEYMRKGVVIHHGSIPLKARLLIEEFVRAGYARICFATSTLNQGINMPFDAVWLARIDRLKPLDLKNLIGRSGRSQQNDVFDFGYTIVESDKRELFLQKYNQAFEISEQSQLELVSAGKDEDVFDLVESLRNNSFNDNLFLPQSQVDRIMAADINGDVSFLLDSFFGQNEVITGKQYNELGDSRRKKIKEALGRLYSVHLLRQELTTAEKSVLSTAIPILLWRIQGKSFSQIVSMRFAYLSRKDEQKIIKKRLKSKEIKKSEANELLSKLEARVQTAPAPLPDKKLSRSWSFTKTAAENLSYDHVIYDTYDYLDKVISLSMVDPLCAVFEVYFERSKDERARKLINFIRYGTDDSMEIYLLRYGFDFEEIEWLKPHIEQVNTEEIVFANSIKKLSDEKMKVIQRYI